MALGPRAAHGLCCISRPKRHPGSGPLSSNVRPHGPPTETYMFRKSILAPLILIILGLLFLLSNLGLLPHLGPLFAKWWPLILVAVGVSLLLRRL